MLEDRHIGLKDFGRSMPALPCFGMNTTLDTLQDSGMYLRATEALNSLNSWGRRMSNPRCKQTGLTPSPPGAFPLNPTEGNNTARQTPLQMGGATRMSPLTFGWLFTLMNNTGREVYSHHNFQNFFRLSNVNTLIVLETTKRRDGILCQYLLQPCTALHTVSQVPQVLALLNRALTLFLKEASSELHQATFDLFLLITGQLRSKEPTIAEVRPSADSVYDAQPLRHASLRHGSPHTVGLGCPQSKTSFCVVRFQADPDWHNYCAAPRAVTAQSAQSRHYPRSWGFVDSRATSSRTLSSVYPSPTIG
ncbi:hypothetical protein J6590_048823 [Homalodisca vitripennis]|nr:hypothetical protein J6590_048823 [Homalodisca vitripennis]